MKNVSVNMLYIYAHFKINKSFLFHEIINYKIKLCPFFQRKPLPIAFPPKKRTQIEVNNLVRAKKALSRNEQFGSTFIEYKTTIV